MPRLIAVSHRVRIETEGDVSDTNPLPILLCAMLRANKGLWFGWSGEQANDFTGRISFRSADGIAAATIDLEAKDIAESRDGFAERVLRPLFHHQSALPESADDDGAGYDRVNRRFAEALEPLAGPDDLIWVHDYHLIPLAQHLRARGIDNRIGFFLHLPWPAPSLLMSLPGHRKLALGMFDYDVIGFQCEYWRQAFIAYVTAHFDAIWTGDILCVGERRVRLLVSPAGLDTADFSGAVHALAARQSETRLAVSTVGREVIVGVDRLDHSSGLHERFAAFALMLDRHPALREKVSLLQIAPPFRSDEPYRHQLRADLDALTGRINSAFAAIDWTPIRFVNQSFSRDELFGIYRAAKVGLVTPLCDGMGLIAKEYVAAQNPDDPGVLVLSRFTGVAAQLTQAVIVDPSSAEDVADGIARALAMPLAERQERHRALLECITTQDVHWWASLFLDALGNNRAPQPVAHRLGTTSRTR